MCFCLLSFLLPRTREELVTTLHASFPCSFSPRTAVHPVDILHFLNPSTCWQTPEHAQLELCTATSLHSCVSRHPSPQGSESLSYTVSLLKPYSGWQSSFLLSPPKVWETLAVSPPPFIALQSNWTHVSSCSFYIIFLSINNVECLYRFISCY